MLKFLQTRRATCALAEAMRLGDEKAMAAAIDQGASLSKVSATFDEPAQHFQMSYEVRGALELAVEYRLPLSTFALLLDAGAPVPRKADRSPDPKALFTHEQLQHWPQAPRIVEMIECGAAAPSTAKPARRAGP